MPNWVYNGLTAEGKPESITKLVDQLNQPFSLVHDSWDIESGEMKKKLTTYPNPVFAFWNIIKPTDMEAYSSQPDHSKDIYDRSGDDWYNWNVRNWGTKWDVAKSSNEDHDFTYMEGPVDNGDNKVVYYSFNTAWGVPMPALVTLSTQYPDLLFTLSYEEETGWGGELELLRGVLLSDEQYTWKCSDCDLMLEQEPQYCEDCENYVCPQCSFGAEDDHNEHVMEEANV